MLGLGNSIIGGAALDQFTPASINNLALWLKQGTGITSDGGTPDKVSQWNDSSGNDNHATQSTSGNQADLVGTGTGVGLDFERDNADFYNLAADPKITISQDHNFIVGFVISPESIGSHLDESDGRMCILSDDNNEFVDIRIDKVAINCTGSEVTFTGDANLFSNSATSSVVISRNDGSTGTFTLSVNGVTPAGSFNGTQAKAIEFDTLGGRNQTGRPYDGIIHELVVYDLGTGTVTAAELTSLNNYFTSKFGL